MPFQLLLCTLLTATIALSLPRQSATRPRELVVCGWDEVFTLRLERGLDAAPRRSWSWRAKGRADMPDDIEALFNTTDDCKPFEGGSKILVTSSGGGVAFVDRVNDRVLFHGRAANAHSADLLPRGRVAVAASHDRAGKGDRLILFDLTASDRELSSVELPWGHGVVWDEQRRLLWALSGEDLRVYELGDWGSATPKLQRVALIPLPERGGHDLSVVNTTLLAVSTANHCWVFDRNARTFQPHPELGDKAGVKSINHDPQSGQVAYVQAEGKNWWAERIHFLRPADSLHVAGEHFYKARWSVQ